MKWFVHCYAFSYDLAPEQSAVDRKWPEGTDFTPRGAPTAKGWRKGLPTLSRNPLPLHDLNDPVRRNIGVFLHLPGGPAHF
jgi:hypothetical protein